MGVFQQILLQTLGLALLCANVFAQTFFHHSDPLGSASLATDVSGVVVQEQEYTPFGEILSTLHSTLDTPHYQFTGQEKDPSTELYNYGARYYDPATSRFVSVDPARESPNPYAYVLNNPILYTDPTGETVYPSLPSRELQLWMLEVFGDSNLFQASVGMLAGIGFGSTSVANNPYFRAGYGSGQNIAFGTSLPMGGPPRFHPTAYATAALTASEIHAPQPRPTSNWNQSLQSSESVLIPRLAKLIKRLGHRCVYEVYAKANQSEHRGNLKKFAIFERIEDGIKYAHTTFLYGETHVTTDPQTGDPVVTTTWMADERISNFPEGGTFFGLPEKLPFEEEKAIFREAYPGIQITVHETFELGLRMREALTEFKAGTRGDDLEWSALQGVIRRSSSGRGP